MTTPKKKATKIPARLGRPPGWCGRADAAYWYRASAPFRWKCAECRAEFGDNPTDPAAPLSVRRGHFSACSQHPTAEVNAINEKRLRAQRMTYSLANFLRPTGLDASNATGSWGEPPDPDEALRIARETHAALGAWLKTWDAEPAKEDPAP